MPKIFTSQARNGSAVINMDGWPTPAVIVPEEPYPNFTAFVTDALNHYAKHKIDEVAHGMTVEEITGSNVPEVLCNKAESLTMSHEEIPRNSIIRL